MTDTAPAGVVGVPKIDIVALKTAITEYWANMHVRTDRIPQLDVAARRMYASSAEARYAPASRIISGWFAIVGRQVAADIGAVDCGRYAGNTSRE